MINVIAKFVAKENTVEETRTALEALLTPSHQDVGCVSYELFQDVNAKNVFFMFEAWENEQFLNKHLATPHLVNFIKQADTLLKQPMEISILTALNKA